MDASPESWATELGSEDDDNFTDQVDLDSADFQVEDHDKETPFQETMSSDEFTQQLIDLSALVPGSTKINEASVISKTIEYLKELHETIASLEDKAVIEHDEAAPVPSNEKSRASTEKDVSDITSNCKIEGESGHDEMISTTSSESLPEIETRFLNKDVLVRIHCMKSKGVIVNILNHLEHLHLSVTRSSVLHFGDSLFEISIIAQMDDGFMASDKELARSLRKTIMSNPST